MIWFIVALNAILFQPAQPLASISWAPPEVLQSFDARARLRVQCVGQHVAILGTVTGAPVIKMFNDDWEVESTIDLTPNSDTPANDHTYSIDLCESGADGTLLVAGRITTGGSAAPWVCIVDDARVSASKVIGIAPHIDSVRVLAQMATGHLVVGGSQRTPGAEDSDGWLAVLDSSLELLHTRSISLGDDEQVMAVELRPSGEMCVQVASGEWSAFGLVAKKTTVLELATTLETRRSFKSPPPLMEMERRDAGRGLLVKLPQEKGGPRVFAAFCNDESLSIGWPATSAEADMLTSYAYVSQRDGTALIAAITLRGLGNSRTGLQLELSASDQRTMHKWEFASTDARGSISGFSVGERQCGIVLADFEGRLPMTFQVGRARW